MKKFIGTGVALITPFNADLSIDFDALERLVEYNISNGTNYLVISGTTGESVTVTSAEKKELVTFISKVNKGRLPLVLGIGGNNTAEVIKEIQSTDFSEIDGVLSVSPYYSKPTQEGIYQHFKAIAEVCPKPIILYNVPGRTSSNMLPETTVRLAKDFENIVAVKEAANNVQQYLELLRTKPNDFLIISGDDDLALGIVLAGGSGVISVIGQALPEEYSKMIQLGLAGKAKEAYEIHFKLMPITGHIFAENNPAGIKAVLSGLKISKPHVRLPLVEATKNLKDIINNELKVLGKS
ncbi:4-hydroxy-tetrahydrodipicolinate synthase [Winogradskyella epiphytica]|uniref:4-hydroxy-tetrahydrodipicolinate synthase n=1 Tax=Winogradskyella epiphytica TaxID=262005 RepID=A0A2V4WW59_9FLAO|nr:4-hydroxy-tetrahydrodipicolinate synthase [Winogradskyella epiphytica]PYE81460.1 4-hydroxy-tetrahydrodipicolinate synthase [Winogradskyella epiphytica]GGW64989.1 4-hydroxy-tetrahydrodipicolinate synthase [Winogradskyella epiphytica]